MYNGIGLTTPRGSGTNGYVQRNLSALRVHQTPADRAAAWDIAPPKHREPDAAILEHEKKRKVEVKCLELELQLEDQGLDETEVQGKVQELREKLNGELASLAPSMTALRPSDTHAIAAAKKVELDKMARALGTKRDYTEGDAFDREKQEENRLRRMAEREEREKRREAERVRMQEERERVEAEHRERERLRRREEDRIRSERERARERSRDRSRERSFRERDRDERDYRRRERSPPPHFRYRRSRSRSPIRRSSRSYVPPTRYRPRDRSDSPPRRRRSRSPVRRDRSPFVSPPRAPYRSRSSSVYSDRRSPTSSLSSRPRSRSVDRRRGSSPDDVRGRNLSRSPSLESPRQRGRTRSVSTSSSMSVSTNRSRSDSRSD